MATVSGCTMLRLCQLLDSYPARTWIKNILSAANKLLLWHVCICMGIEKDGEKLIM